MTLIRHKTTLEERTVPEQAVPYFPDYETVAESAEAAQSDDGGEQSTADAQLIGDQQPTAKTTTQRSKS